MRVDHISERDRRSLFIDSKSGQKCGRQHFSSDCCVQECNRDETHGAGTAGTVSY